MTRDPSRKGPQRTRTDELRGEIDDDLVELAAVIAEHKLENNARNWFVLPWRSGWNPIRLLLDLDRFFHKPMSQTLEQEAIRKEACDKLNAWLVSGETTREVYWAADELRMLGPSRPLASALRCLTVLISKSDGGGHVYNDILKLIFDREIALVGHSNIVMEARCHDAIGVGPQLENDRFDRQRRAFKIAWERGLYSAAYAISPIKR